MQEKFVKGGPLPKSIGAVVDLYREVRDLRLAMEKEVKPIAERESELRQYLIDNIAKSDDGGAVGKKYVAKIVTKVVPKAEDWETIRAYIQETGRFDLMNKSLSAKAVSEMWEAGEEVPGVGRFNAIDVSITKL